MPHRRDLLPNQGTGFMQIRAEVAMSITIGGSSLPGTRSPSDYARGMLAMFWAASVR